MSDNKEQCRAEFEAWLTEEFGYALVGTYRDGGYVDKNSAMRFHAWKAAYNRRAAQPVVLSDEQPDYELHCDGEFAASASGKNAHLDILHYAAQYAQDGEIEIFKVTRTKIDPSILAAKEQA